MTWNQTYRAERQDADAVTAFTSEDTGMNDHQAHCTGRHLAVTWEVTAEPHIPSWSSLLGVFPRASHFHCEKSGPEDPEDQSIEYVS